MSTITRFFASILAVLQIFFSGVSYGEFGEIAKDEKTETEIINNIDSQTNMAESIKFANKVKNQAQAKYTDPDRSVYFDEIWATSRMLVTVEKIHYMEGNKPRSRLRVKQIEYLD